MIEIFFIKTFHEKSIEGCDNVINELGSMISNTAFSIFCCLLLFSLTSSSI